MSSQSTLGATTGTGSSDDLDHPADRDTNDIRTRTGAIQHMPTALIDVSDLFGVGESLSEKLIEAGFSTIPDIHHSPKWQLTLIDGVGDDTARALKSLAASRCDHHFGDYSWEPFKKYEPGIVQSSTPDSR